MSEQHPLHNQWMPTEEEMVKIEALAGVGLTEEQIADYLGVGRTTFNMAANKNDPMRQRILHGRSNALANVAKTAYSMAMKGDNPSMTQFYLKCRGGWKFKTVIEHEGLQESEEKRAKEVVEKFRGLISQEDK